MPPSVREEAAFSRIGQRADHTDRYRVGKCSRQRKQTAKASRQGVFKDWPGSTMRER